MFLEQLETVVISVFAGARRPGAVSCTAAPPASISQVQSRSVSVNPCGAMRSPLEQLGCCKKIPRFW